MNEELGTHEVWDLLLGTMVSADTQLLGTVTSADTQLLGTMASADTQLLGMGYCNSPITNQDNAILGFPPGIPIVAAAKWHRIEFENQFSDVCGLTR